MDQLIRQIIPTEINPIVSSYAGATGAYLISGIMAGEYLLTDPSKGTQPTGVDPLTLFNYLKTDNYGGPSLTGQPPRNKRANFGMSNLNVGTAGYVSNGSVIYRMMFQQGLLLGRDGNPTEQTHSLNIGAVSILINPDTDTLMIPTEITGAGVL